MPKTYPWSTIIPSGSEQASTADDHLRRLRLEIEERMNDIVVDWGADPVAIDQTKIGNVVGKVMNLHSSAFVVEPGEEAAFEYGNTGVTISNTANPTRAALILPLGVTVRRVRWLVTNGDTAAITMVFGSVAFAVGAAHTTICEMTTVTAGSQIVDSDTVSPFSTVATGDVMYYLSIDKGGGAEFTLHGVSITYDTSNVSHTI